MSAGSNVTVGDLRATCPNLCREVDKLAEQWLAPVIKRLADIDQGRDILHSKHLNDPIWRTFEIEDREVLLLDSPLLQRMRGVKQLGLANMVFPAANHDRFEHICGVVDAADRMFVALQINADRRREHDRRAGREPPSLDDFDRICVRLAALLHDVGHGPFSHAIEPVVAAHNSGELKAFNEYVTMAMHLDSKADIAELISILIVLSPSMGSIFQHSLFRRPADCPAPELQVRICTLIMGARRHGYLACLSAIVSGQVDADKLDYMARDAHHSGMPIAFDTERLLRKLEIVHCTSKSLPRNQTRNIEFAEASPGGYYFDLGIAAAGVGALEQMLIGRAFLYDRLYHHHKVRAADAMAQRLLHFVQRARNRPFGLSELYLGVSDDSMIRILGGELKMDGFEAPGSEAAFLARAILDRNLFVRAFAFRSSFHSGLPPSVGEKQITDARADIWNPVSTELSDLAGRLEAEERIVELAKRVAPHAGDSALAALADRLRREYVIVDLADNRVKPVTINIHSADGALEEPNLFFDPARWSQVYNLQKRTGYVFCPREYVALVALAAKIFFFERWGFAASEQADRFTKTANVIQSEWIAKLRESATIDALTEQVLRREVTIRTYVRAEDIVWPEPWANESPDVKDEIVDELRVLIPQGISAEDKKAVIDTISGLASFVHAMHQDSRWITQTSLKEKDLQEALARHLRARALDVSEGGRLGGGEYDLVVGNRALIENKVAGVESDPFDAKPDAPYQANRYAIAKCQRIFFTAVAYTPKDGADILEQTRSIRVRKLEGVARTAAEVCVVIPYGASTPSKVKKPASSS
jgi:HD superfamily phosphohydrolase